jgi:HD-like signal output (HDOD) protein
VSCIPVATSKLDTVGKRLKCYRKKLKHGNKLNSCFYNISPNQPNQPELEIPSGLPLTLSVLLDDLPCAKGRIEAGNQRSINLPLAEIRNMNQQLVPKEFVGRLAPHLDWRSIVAWVEDLPPMPRVAQKALVLVEDPNASLRDVSELLASDPALAARVLKIANSALFARQREIKTLSQAVSMIGFKGLKGIIVAATLRGSQKSLSTNERLVWDASVGCGQCCAIIVKKLGRPFVEELFILGLLHSLGQMVMLNNASMGQRFDEVLKRIADHQEDFRTAEEAIYGFSHPLIGALVAKKWNFSSEMCDVILHYADPAPGPVATTPHDEKVGILKLASLLTHAAGIGNPAGYPCSQDLLVETATFAKAPTAGLDTWLTEAIEATKEQFKIDQAVYSG